VQSTAARWGAVALWLGLAPLLVLSGSSPPFHVGAIAEVEITLVSSDRGALACTSDRPLWGHACKYREGGRVVQPKGTMVPCMTSDRRPLLVPGLFEQPAVAARVARDEGVPLEKRGRFLARCRVRVLEQVTGVQVRFSPAAPFVEGPKSWLVSPIACSVHEDRGARP
jgi:hypothetical protein